MCGYAVEWLRERDGDPRRTFRSFWRLDPNSETLTEGRYYRVSDSTPFFPGYHYLGARHWNSDEREAGDMGEYEGPRYSDRGDEPLVMPEVKRVGSLAAIAAGGGDATAEPTADDVFDRFLPAACYENLRGSPGERIARCPDRSLFAYAMSFVNEGGWEFWARQLCTEAAEVQLHREEDGSLYSSYGLVRDGNECHIYIDGTRNFGQLITQAYGATAGPRDYGDFTANPLYEANARRVLRAATRFGCDTCTRFILIGHSYGGATATVAAAILKRTQPQAELAVITEGAPRAGGRKLMNWLATVPQRHYRRPLDPIPLLPPDRTSGNWLFFTAFDTIAAVVWAAWGGYADYRNTFTLYPGGSFGTEAADPPSVTLMDTLALQIYANVPIGSYDAHNLANYRLDMAASCGET